MKAKGVSFEFQRSSLPKIPPSKCRVPKGTGSQVDVILNKEARADSILKGCAKLSWKLLGFT